MKHAPIGKEEAANKTPKKEKKKRKHAPIREEEAHKTTKKSKKDYEVLDRNMKPGMHPEIATDEATGVTAEPDEDEESEESEVSVKPAKSSNPKKKKGAVPTKAAVPKKEAVPKKVAAPKQAAVRPHPTPSLKDSIQSLQSSRNCPSM